MCFCVLSARMDLTAGAGDCHWPAVSVIKQPHPQHPPRWHQVSYLSNPEETSQLLTSEDPLPASDIENHTLLFDTPPALGFPDPSLSWPSSQLLCLLLCLLYWPTFYFLAPSCGWYPRFCEYLSSVLLPSCLSRSVLTTRTFWDDGNVRYLCCPI